MESTLTFLHNYFAHMCTGQSLYIALLTLAFSIWLPYSIWLSLSPSRLAYLMRANRKISLAELNQSHRMPLLIILWSFGFEVYIGGMFLIHWYAAMLVSTVFTIIFSIVMVRDLMEDPTLDKLEQPEASDAMSLTS